MYKIDIYDKKTKEVVETKEVKNLRGFMAYWAMQCDTEAYGYKIRSEAK